MSVRWFTADFHLQMKDVLRFENRPFADIQTHDRHLIDQCKMTSRDDTILHLGDLYSFGLDRNSENGIQPPSDILQQIPATFVNIRGNHDPSNKVKSVCDSMQIHLGKKFPYVICAHYPSYDKRAVKYIKNGYILLCGHVHRKWRHFLDLNHQILNINVGVDVWNYKLISEDQLIQYILKIINLPKDKLNTTL